MLFEVKDLHVRIGAKEIIHGLNLKLGPGSIHFMMGPNGAGKSSLAMALMGHPDFSVSGGIFLDGADISRLSADERARRGMFLSFQNPEEIEGVKLGNLVRKAQESRSESGPDLDLMVKARNELIKDSEKLGLGESFISRDLNVGFSGGEKKRAEILQMIALRPRLVILDEADSGLDVDGVRIVADSIKKMADGSRAFLIITHYPRLLKHLVPDRVHILDKGAIIESGGPELAHRIEARGFPKERAKTPKGDLKTGK